jgi:hypothetical protein
MLEALRAEWSKRPWWMNLVFVFCLYMAFIYVPFDFFFKPIERDDELWFGIALHGVWAKATEPLHWAIYAAGAWGFWKMRGWMWPWAAIYCAQIVIGMWVWGFMGPQYSGPFGAAFGIVFLILTIALWRSRHLFGGQPKPQPA